MGHILFFAISALLTLQSLQVIVDNLMLNPVSQIIMDIRENTEQLAGKIK